MPGTSRPAMTVEIGDESVKLSKRVWSLVCGRDELLGWHDFYARLAAKRPEFYAADLAAIKVAMRKLGMNCHGSE